MKKKSKLGLVGRLVGFTILSVLVTAVSLFCISASRINGTYKELIKEELAATGAHLQSQLANEYDGDWTLSDNGKLLKGGTDVSEEFEQELDELKSETGVEYTLYYGDTRMVTTLAKADGSAKLTGTKASDAVLSAVLQDGNAYYVSDLMIEGTKYFGYYIPVENSDGTIIGMCFTGRNADSVSKAIARIIVVLIVTVVLIVIAVIVAGFLINHSISGKMRSVSGDLTKLADGSLRVEIGQKVTERSDELGEIGNSVMELIGRLGEIIGNTKRMSEELTESGTELAKNCDSASQTAAQITSAVDDISKGAASQAESIQTAASETGIIGSSIEHISGNVEILNIASGKMKANCNGTKQVLETLILQAKKVVDSVDLISRTIEQTDRGAKEISAFTDEINSIASKTNLLSLNAAIEAARAGESGKGFAVVASEISDLAAQSKQSADKINEITSGLMKDVAESVQVVHQLTEDIGEQGRQLDATKEAMDRMELGIGNVAKSASEIRGQVDELGNTRETLNYVISDLSAVSEENAASTQETNASMEALKDTFAMISESAEGLRILAGKLTETISYFG